MLTKIFPFLAWFKKYDTSVLQADFVAGLNVALVLIPQSMAYAQLAGLPVYYGLYASFVPPMLAAMFGSSHQLATGPVAVVSLMTSAALSPLATQGSEGYIAYAILLAFLVGLFQFMLGVLRLGIIVNFLSHPVVNGFTNAAALIIATSQLSKIFGVYVDKAEHHYETIWRVINAAFYYTHWPTMGIAVLAFTIMLGLKKTAPKVPNVLMAVAITTLISWGFGFQHDVTTDISAIQSPEVKETIHVFNQTMKHVTQLSDKRAELNQEMRELESQHEEKTESLLQLRHEKSLLNISIEEEKEKSYRLRKELRSYLFHGVKDAEGDYTFYLWDDAPTEKDGYIWRMKVGNRPLDTEHITMMAGGDVVGHIPQGLPAIHTPDFRFSIMLQLFPMAAIISLLGFMEAISIAKAMAAKTGQRLDPNQELIGQGLANIVGSFSQSYPVSGSFSRSAVNIQAGALTGMSSVFTSCMVVIVLLFFTPLLFYLPQATLAAIIMMAVIGLIDLPGIAHAWSVQKADGIIAIVTFIGTLLFAPHLEKGIFIGVAMALSVALYRHMRPQLAVLSKHPDGSYRNAERWGLQQCKYIAVIRFNGSLFFANASYLEDKVLELVASKPELKHVLIVGNAVNELDASGEEMLSKLIDQLHEAGYEVSFSGLNDEIVEVMRRTPLYQKIGRSHMFRNVHNALQAIHAKAHEYSAEKECPLLHPSIKDFKAFAVTPEAKRSAAILQKKDQEKK